MLVLTFSLLLLNYKKLGLNWQMKSEPHMFIIDGCMTDSQSDNEKTFKII